MTSSDCCKPEILQWIRAHFPTAARILDVGPGWGTYARLLPEYRRMEAVEVWQPYVDKYALEELYSVVHVGDALPFLATCDHYDLIILGDVLEHFTIADAQLLMERCRTKAKALVVSVLIGAPLLAGVLALFEHAGPRAWLYGWALAVFFMAGIQFVAPRLILPLFNKFTPLDEGELRAAIFHYTRSIRFPLENVFIMDGSRRSTKSNAFFTGFGKHRRIALFDTLIRAHTVPELVAILAHETGHYRKKHVLKNMAFGAVLSGALLFAFSFALRSPILFEAFFVEQPSVYAGLVLFSLLLRPFDLLLSLLLNIVSRSHELEADRFAVETTNDRNALVSALKKLSADNLSNLSPHPLHVALSYSHPPIQQRIRSIENIPAASSVSIETPDRDRKN